MNAEPRIEERVELKKSLSAWHIWALALGCIVGWGCFVLPGTNFLPNAGPGATLIGFAAGAILLSFVAISYGSLIANYPVAGGEFAYAYAGFGPKAAFICGWALTLGYMSIVAINISALALLFRFLLPGVFNFGYLYTIVGWDVYLGEVLMMTTAVILFGYMNCIGVSVAGSIQLFLTGALVLSVFALTFGVVSTETFSLSNLTPAFSEKQSALSSILTIVAISPFLYVGFDTVPQAAEEFSFSPKKANALMLIAILFGAVLYSLVTFSVGSIIPYKELLGSNPDWATGTVANLALGKMGSIVLGTAVLAAVCTGINGFYLATSRLIFSIARSQFLPSWFSYVHPKYKTPYNAVIFTTVICLLTPWAGRAVVGWIVDMCSVGTVIAYGFTCMTCYKMLASRQENNARGRIIAIAGTVISAAILGLLLVPGSPAFIAAEPLIIMAIWLAVGVAFYKIQIPYIRSIPEADIREQIFGDRNIQVFFDSKEEKQGQDMEAVTE